MIKLVGVAGLALMMLSGTGYGESAPPFEFRSHRIGDSLDTKYPQWRKARPLRGPGCETWDKETGIVRCDDIKSYVYTGGFASQTVGGVVVFSLRYGFLDGKLYNMEMLLHSVGRYGMLSMLYEKYGQPASRTSEKLENRSGASFENVTATWDFREGILKFNSITSQADRSELIFENPTAEREILLRRMNRAKERQKHAL